MRRALVSLLAAGIVGMAGSAAAADPASPDVPPTDDAAKHAIDRTWLYLDDARVAAPWTVIGMSNVSYTNVGSNPTQLDSPYPSTYNSFAMNTAQPGGMISVGGELGIFPRISVMALAQVGFGGVAGTPNPDAGAVAGMRFQLFPSSWTNTHLVASAGYLREATAGPVYDDDTDTWHPPIPGGDNGAWFQAAFSGDVQRVRMGATVHGEHIFSPGRDPLDVMVQLGVSYRVVRAFRVGVEYVGQDLEETFEDGAEGGARHFVGPTTSLQLLQDRLTIVAGPSFGLSDTSPRLLGRLALAYGF